MFLLQEFNHSSSFFRSLLVFIPVIAIFWFLVISPQRKEEKKKKDMIKNLKKGDKVLTIGGIFGIVKKVSDSEVVLELSPTSDVKFVKNSVERIILDEIKDKN
ncbi:preprotein translocase subunit YajC [Borrelia coriaceae]|uniref:Sec translocon accessory complex subunit YajC n=1 Tax=Borrelia coriaceae ATCC 43381 TaxID=1408429 RepID=W5SVD7_9SPIR|nr:preprotein translocase subunit YajC [Borrelia coriaceae]AHH10842.1 Protein translocase subunit YajC [Borrelia coriaceae ATCC 43381]UPA16496.1 preprotein translocase subunit YajC [Borrelia coriaceae]